MSDGHDGYKIIHDGIHGSMKVSGVILDLVKTPEFQRLRQIKQLGLAYLVYPGANHSRFEHSLGAWHLAKRLSEEVGLPKEESELLQVGALLHDIGHGPLSHTFEGIYKHYVKERDHMRLGQDIILGNINITGDEDGGRIPEILEKHGIDPKAVADIILGRSEKPYLGQMLHGGVDVDQLDYLVRDAHYTGVAHGIIDLERLLKVMKIHDGQLVVDEKGIEAVEGMMVARALMYSRVYFHHTVKIAEGMLTRALEFALDEGHLWDFWRMTDCRVLVELEDLEGLPAELTKRVLHRKLYKAAVLITAEELSTEEKRELLNAYRNVKKRQEIERNLADAVGASEGEVILEFSIADLMLSEPRLKETGINVLLDNGEIQPLTKVTPLANALKRRQTPRWAVMIASPEKYVDRLREVWRRVIFS
ncbi:metal-dependent phosphohydrolase, HD superfamily [Thermococcus kodakarensis KOD1]|uniref:Metal-dependent phosphohydrolase, HD superfamily n=1 Tax=Thermococcus kodakarensis (strain ATCC BAA-918 / JCM 12380 / KOD1) TaxID=69014 RepID=Q5JF27_THEKO|nr:HD domain-containing protein [Thermococcus kodakarensis]WCN30890.1 HD domain-containing protein [Thermococcus kodakarensis]BAD84729.1 metal-dependent phosphohydrolase, HD superfamily [Thermococcus kodakarensis KOD1]